MKLKSVLGVMLACLVAASCSKHDDGADVLKGEETWVALSLGKQKTYASSVGSTNEEKKINTVDIFFFTPDPTKENSKIEQIVSFDATKSELNPTTTGATTDAFKTTTTAKYMVVLVNAPSAFIADIKAYDNIEGNDLKLGDLLPGGQFGNFEAADEAVFNSQYAKNVAGQGNFVMVNDNPTELVSFPLQHDRGALNPVPISVGRIVSKVVVWYSLNRTLELSFSNSKDDFNSVDYHVSEVSALLDNKNRKSFVLADNGVGVNLKDPNFSSYNTSEFLVLGSDYNSNFETNKVNVNGLESSAPFYCFENTIEQDWGVSKYAYEDNSTNLILRLKLNNGNTFYMTERGTLTTNPSHSEGKKYTYTNGYCYYRIYLKRTGVKIPNSAPLEADYYDAYGVVRNNLYDVTINAVNSIGSHTIAALQAKPILTANLLNVDITVKDWELTTNIVEIP